MAHAVLASLRRVVAVGVGVVGGGGRLAVAMRRRGMTDLAHLKAFEGFLGPDGVVVDGEVLEQHNTDWTKAFHGASEVALLPTSTEQVSAVLAYCSSRGINVVPQGACVRVQQCSSRVACGPALLVLPLAR